MGNFKTVNRGKMSSILYPLEPVDSLSNPVVIPACPLSIVKGRGVILSEPLFANLPDYENEVRDAQSRYAIVGSSKWVLIYISVLPFYCHVWRQFHCQFPIAISVCC
jgi:hypothetical protein